jgi:hypothetical protein
MLLKQIEEQVVERKKKQESKSNQNYLSIDMISFFFQISLCKYQASSL